MVTIRKFLLADLGKVMEIEKNSFPKSKAYSKKYFEKFYQDYPESFVVAGNGETVIGYGIGQPKRNSAELVSLAVRPEFRQKGIGTELAGFLLNHFKKNGVKEILLDVRTENKIALDFYQKMGFKIVKTVKKYYRNDDDAYLMRREV